MSVTALAERLHIDRTNVSRLCARMESLGDLVRSPDPDDARAWRVHLTARGARAADAVDAASAAHFAGILARLDDSGAILDAMRALARAMTPDSEPER
jgi:DNA-binding MarR family transcriptional regulator